MPAPTASRLLVLGETSFRQEHQPFGLLPADRLRHLSIIGKTGSGKSTLLANLIRQDLERGQGLALLDPHGDLVEAVLPLVPRHRTNEVVLFSPGDADFPVSFNVFRHGRQRQPDIGLLASALVGTFRKYWFDSWGPRLEHVLRNAVLAVAPNPRATLLFLYRFLTDEEVRAGVVARVKDPVVRQFWVKEFPNYPKALQAEAVAPVLNKLGAFVAMPQVRNIVGQERSRIDLGQIMKAGGIVLANLSTGGVGEDASHLLGGLLLTSIQLAAMSRPQVVDDRGAPGRRPFIVYVDEFQHFVTDALATMLSESRKFGLGLVLAHQYLAQIGEKIRDAVLGNVGSMMLFHLGATDALLLEAELAPAFTAFDLQNIGRHQAVVRLLSAGQLLAPFSARMLPGPRTPMGGSEQVDRIRAQSRARYCQGRDRVEVAILRALSPDK